MALPKTYAKKQAKAKRRSRLNAKTRHQRQQHDAQRTINALCQALHDLGFPDHLVTEIEGRLKAQKKLLGKVFGLMFPTLFGCTSAHELTRVRGWDKNQPSRILGALPKRSWIKRLRKLGQDILVPLWRHVESMSIASLFFPIYLNLYISNGTGCGMTRCFANMANTLSSSVAGTVANTSGWLAALMAFCWWSSLAMAN